MIHPKKDKSRTKRFTFCPVVICLDKEKASKVMKIVERLEELDDVQQVSTNLDLPDDFEVED